MKYIMLETAIGQKLPIIFPDTLIHALVAGAIQLAVDVLDPRKNLRENQCARLLEAASAKPVSAGFVSLGEVSVHGASESLSLGTGAYDAARITIGQSVEFMPDAMLAPLWARIK